MGGILKHILNLKCGVKPQVLSPVTLSRLLDEMEERSPGDDEEAMKLFTQAAPGLLARKENVLNILRVALHVDGTEPDHRRAALAQRYVRSQKFTERLSSYRDDLLILIHELLLEYSCAPYVPETPVESPSPLASQSSWGAASATAEVEAGERGVVPFPNLNAAAVSTGPEPERGRMDEDGAGEGGAARAAQASPKAGAAGGHGAGPLQALASVASHALGSVGSQGAQACDTAAASPAAGNNSLSPLPQRREHSCYADIPTPIAEVIAHVLLHLFSEQLWAAECIRSTPDIIATLVVFIRVPPITELLEELLEVPSINLAISTVLTNLSTAAAVIEVLRALVGVLLPGHPDASLLSVNAPLTAAKMVLAFCTNEPADFARALHISGLLHSLLAATATLYESAGAVGQVGAARKLSTSPPADSATEQQAHRLPLTMGDTATVNFLLEALCCLLNCASLVRPPASSAAINPFMQYARATSVGHSGNAVLEAFFASFGQLAGPFLSTILNSSIARACDSGLLPTPPPSSTSAPPPPPSTLPVPPSPKASTADAMVVEDPAFNPIDVDETMPPSPPPAPAYQPKPPPPFIPEGYMCTSYGVVQRPLGTMVLRICRLVQIMACCGLPQVEEAVATSSACMHLVALMAARPLHNPLCVAVMRTLQEVMHRGGLAVVRHALTKERLLRILAVLPERVPAAGGRQTIVAYRTLVRDLIVQMYQIMTDPSCTDTYTTPPPAGKQLFYNQQQQEDEQQQGVGQGSNKASPGLRPISGTPIPPIPGLPSVGHAGGHLGTPWGTMQKKANSLVLQRQIVLLEAVEANQQVWDKLMVDAAALATRRSDWACGGPEQEAQAAAEAAAAASALEESETNAADGQLGSNTHEASPLAGMADMLGEAGDETFDIDANMEACLEGSPGTEYDACMQEQHQQQGGDNTAAAAGAFEGHEDPDLHGTEVLQQAWEEGLQAEASCPQLKGLGSAAAAYGAPSQAVDIKGVGAHSGSSNAAAAVDEAEGEAQEEDEEHLICSQLFVPAAEDMEEEHHEQGKVEDCGATGSPHSPPRVFSNSGGSTGSGGSGSGSPGCLSPGFPGFQVASYSSPPGLTVAAAGAAAGGTPCSPASPSTIASWSTGAGAVAHSSSPRSCSPQRPDVGVVPCRPILHTLPPLSFCSPIRDAACTFPGQGSPEAHSTSPAAAAAPGSACPASQGRMQRAAADGLEREPSDERQQDEGEVVEQERDGSLIERGLMLCDEVIDALCEEAEAEPMDSCEQQEQHNTTPISQAATPPPSIHTQHVATPLPRPAFMLIQKAFSHAASTGQVVPVMPTGQFYAGPTGSGIWDERQLAAAALAAAATSGSPGPAGFSIGAGVAGEPPAPHEGHTDGFSNDMEEDVQGQSNGEDALAQAQHEGQGSQPALGQGAPTHPLKAAAASATTVAGVLDTDVLVCKDQQQDQGMQH